MVCFRDQRTCGFCVPAKRWFNEILCRNATTSLLVYYHVLPFNQAWRQVYFDGLLGRTWPYLFIRIQPCSGEMIESSAAERGSVEREDENRRVVLHGK